VEKTLFIYTYYTYYILIIYFFYKSCLLYVLRIVLRSLTLDPISTKPKEQGTVHKSYSISATNLKYNLPAVSSLQSGMDTRPGNLDTWPAHAEGPGPPAIGPEPSQKNAEFLPKGNYKPKFLGQLESFLKKELRALGCTENKPSEKRLQVMQF
jgi:hypothetical protein